MSQNPINDGGPAFPDPARADGRFGDAGMTLRDYFAAKAMAAFISTAAESCLGGVQGYEIHTAAGAYRMADAMLDAREVQP